MGRCGELALLGLVSGLALALGAFDPRLAERLTSWLGASALDGGAAFRLELGPLARCTFRAAEALERSPVTGQERLSVGLAMVAEAEPLRGLSSLLACDLRRASTWNDLTLGLPGEPGTERRLEDAGGGSSVAWLLRAGRPGHLSCDLVRACWDPEAGRLVQLGTALRLRGHELGATFSPADGRLASLTFCEQVPVARTVRLSCLATFTPAAGDGALGCTGLAIGVTKVGRDWRGSLSVDPERGEVTVAVTLTKLG